MPESKSTEVADYHMTGFELEGVQVFRQALSQLRAAGANLRPLMQEIGEHLVETTKQRFATSRGPDGQVWAENTAITIERYLDRFKGSRTKTGARSTKGKARAGAKKPLIGETKSLSTTIHYELGADSVTLGSSMIYAAVQQFGAKARSFTGGRSPWGDIPARPYLGVSAEDSKAIVQMALDYLAQAVGGSAA